MASNGMVVVCFLVALNSSLSARAQILDFNQIDPLSTSGVAPLGISFGVAFPINPNSPVPLSLNSFSVQVTSIRGGDPSQTASSEIIEAPNTYWTLSLSTLAVGQSLGSFNPLIGNIATITLLGNDPHITYSIGRTNPGSFLDAVPGNVGVVTFTFDSLFPATPAGYTFLSLTAEFPYGAVAVNINNKLGAVKGWFVDGSSLGSNPDYHFAPGYQIDARVAASVPESPLLPTAAGVGLLLGAVTSSRRILSQTRQ